MRAWWMEGTGGLTALKLVDNAPEPVAGPGEVVLAVKYAGLNPADRYLSEGLYPAKPVMPHVLGRDGVGTIAAVGAGVTGWSVGQTAMLLRGEAGVNKPGTLA